MPVRRRGLAHDFLRLALGADEQHDAALGDEVLDEVARLLQRDVGLAEIDDGNALAMIEDVGLGARIPALGLVPEMHAGIEQVFDGDVHDDLCIFRYTGRPEGRLAIELDLMVMGNPARHRLAGGDGRLTVKG